MRTGTPIEFKAVFESIGTEWKPHHLHLESISVTDDFMKDKVNVTLFKGISFDIEGHMELKNAIEKVRELQRGKREYDEFMREGSLIVMPGTVLDMMEVYEDLDNHIIESNYDVRAFGFDPYNAKDFVERWEKENGPFGLEKVIQGAKTESVPLGELKKMAEDRLLLFDEELMTFTMGNCITLEDTNGNRKLYKKRYDQKIDAVAAMMDAYIAYKNNRDAFE